MAEQMQDPGEGGSLEARAAYAKWQMERRQQARLESQPGDVPTEDNPVAAVFARAQQTQQQETAFEQRRQAGKERYEQRRHGRDDVTVDDPDNASARGGGGGQNPVMEELQKQTALLKQILDKIGQAKFQ